ncbi:nitroreductase family protein [Pseudodesulfovibrio sp. zrk46]|uniref:nitroreductase family protein n=1 Tax=Pseudodesulfovibrio sp. zrk46 TaxID=2725288 RepID=UPI001449ECE4|nr:nitroreductase family protein [Pseudodesulfovibrio sp. zrk46]QJB56046.1 4Fe-4S binding protein [Pseudodesulfovibrio sp. zrk46]
MINFKVNEERCIQCGKCVGDCFPRIIAMEQGEYPAILEEEKCIRCQHCLAICPTAAISILGIDPDASMPIAHELPTSHSMETLIKARRSVRKYKKQGLEADVIKRLLETAWHAPTGVNTQGVLFTATMNADVTEALRQEIYTKLGEMLPGLDPEEDDMGIKYMRMSHGAYTKYGVDVILRDAPHILIASTPKSVPTPKEDALIALTSFEIMAQTMGVGTLWNGMLKWCFSDYFPELATRLGVPEDHAIGYSMVFGRPAVQYARTVQRTAPPMNLIEKF